MKWYIGDTHFGHAKMVNWRGDLGGKYRPFETVGEMNDEIHRMWNLRVKPEDTVYHLGDVAFGITQRRSLSNLVGLNGKKELILGNHDTYHDSQEEGNVEDLTRHFVRVHGSKEIVIGNLVGIMTHIPIHPQQLEYRYAFNIHGHLHKVQIDDPRYINVSVENHEYGPVSNDTITAMLRTRGILNV